NLEADPFALDEDDDTLFGDELPPNAPTHTTISPPQPAPDSFSAEASLDFLSSPLDAPSKHGEDPLDFLSSPPKASAPPAEDPLADLYGALAELDQPQQQEKYYHIRRSSGREFGPFPISTIATMLERYELSGEEELSEDGQSWFALREEPTLSGETAPISPHTSSSPRTTPIASPPSSSFANPQKTEFSSPGPEEWSLDASEESLHAHSISDLQNYSTPPSMSSIPSASPSPTRNSPRPQRADFAAQGSGTFALHETEEPITRQRVQTALQTTENKSSLSWLLAGAIALPIVLFSVVGLWFFRSQQPGTTPTDAVKLSYIMPFQQDRFIIYKQKFFRLLTRLQRKDTQQKPNHLSARNQALAYVIALENYRLPDTQRTLNNLLKYALRKKEAYPPKDLWLRTMLAIHQKRALPAKTWVAKFQKADPKHPALPYLLAKTAFLRRQYTRAQNLLQKSPKTPRVLYLLGRVQLQKRAWKDAFHSFEQATLGSNPHMPSLRAALALSLKPHPLPKTRVDALWK
ncbi:MAG: CDC27 family protein, partial [Myxococcota bacterium]